MELHGYNAAGTKKLRRNINRLIVGKEGSSG
jgi:hypothetical protein